MAASAADMGLCDFKDIVAFGNNQLWRPLAAKVKGHHSGLLKKWSACSSWYPEILKELTNDQQDIKNKNIKFVLDLDSKAHIGK